MSEMNFEVTRWEESAYRPEDALYERSENGPVLARVTMRKRYTGRLEGESVGEVQTCGQEGYLATERISGTLDGRRGSFVVQHGATEDGSGAPLQFAYVVPKSGTGELAGLSGDGRVEHGRLLLDLHLPPLG